METPQPEEKDINHEGTDELVCPYCGHEQSHAWELASNSGETECGKCEQHFEYEREVWVYYSTSKINP